MIPGIVAGQIVAQSRGSSSLLVRVGPEEFSKLLSRMKEPLVVVVEGDNYYHYLTSYKGLPFYTKSAEQLRLPGGAEVVNAEGMSIPD